MVHFREPAGAVRSALELVVQLPEAGVPPAHVGVAAGPVVIQGGDYFGRTVNLAARIAASAGPGQVLVSQRVAESAHPRVCALWRGGSRDSRGSLARCGCWRPAGRSVGFLLRLGTARRMHAWLTRCRCRGCTCSMMADALGGGWGECCPVGGLSVECPRRCPDPAGRLIEACLHPTPACAPPPPAPPSCSGGDQGVAVAGVDSHKTPWRPAWSTRPAPSSRPPPSPPP